MREKRWRIIYFLVCLQPPTAPLSPGRGTDHVWRGHDQQERQSGESRLFFCFFPQNPTCLFLQNSAFFFSLKKTPWTKTGTWTFWWRTQTGLLIGPVDQKTFPPSNNLNIFYVLALTLYSKMCLPWARPSRVSSRQGVSLPSPSALRDTQHEEDGSHEERRPLLRRVPQSLHPLAAAIAHPGSGPGVRARQTKTRFCSLLESKLFWCCGKIFIFSLLHSKNVIFK